MDNKIIYFCSAYDSAEKKEAFYRRTIRDRKKVLTATETDVSLEGKSFVSEGEQEKLQLVFFQVPAYQKKEKNWTHEALTRLCRKSLETYREKETGTELSLWAKRQLQERILFQPELAEKFEKSETGIINEAGRLLGKVILSNIDKRAFSRICFILPGDDFFRLEENLYWLKDALTHYFPRVKELGIYLMRSDMNLPPVLMEFIEFLELEYGIIAEVFNMNLLNVKSLFQQTGLKLGITPFVIIDMDGKSILPGILCPAGSYYVDMTSGMKIKQHMMREHPDISYVSPCSLLDTTIKNQYNIVVN